MCVRSVSIKGIIVCRWCKAGGSVILPLCSRVDGTIR
jgi:hypothetical protein